MLIEVVHLFLLLQFFIKSETIYSGNASGGIRIRYPIRLDIRFSEAQSFSLQRVSCILNKKYKTYKKSTIVIRTSWSC